MMDIFPFEISSEKNIEKKFIGNKILKIHQVSQFKKRLSKYNKKQMFFPQQPKARSLCYAFC